MGGGLSTPLLKHNFRFLLITLGTFGFIQVYRIQATVQPNWIDHRYMALLGMRMSSLLSSGRMCGMPLNSHTVKLRVNGISTIKYRLPIAMTTRNTHAVVPSRLYKPLQSISVGRRHTCILYAQLSSASKSRFTLPTSSAKVASTSKSSSTAATKLQERQRLKWRIIARVAYYLRVSCCIVILLVSINRVVDYFICDFFVH